MTGSEDGKAWVFDPAAREKEILCKVSESVVTGTSLGSKKFQIEHTGSKHSANAQICAGSVPRMLLKLWNAAHSIVGTAKGIIPAA